MRLSAKVLLTILLGWLFMEAMTYIGSVTILNRSYVNLENKQALEDINNVNEAIVALEDVNDTNDVNWAWWDTFYNFMVDTNVKSRKNFIDSNFTPNVLSLYELDLALVYDANGRLIISRALNPDRTDLVQLPNEILKLFIPGGKFNRLVVVPEQDNAAKGLVATSNGLLIFSSQNIYDINGKGPTRGTLIFAQYVNSKIWNKLKSTTKLDMNLYPISVIEKNSLLKKEYDLLLKYGTYKIAINENTLELLFLVKDINGSPIAMIKIKELRGIHQLALKTIHYFNLSFLIVGIIFTILLFVLLEMLIIRRLEKMNAKIISIGEKKDFSLRLRESGSDELSSLTHAINELLKTIRSVEATLADVINSMPSILIIVDNDLKVTALNHSAEKTLGISMSEAEGKSIFDLLPYVNQYQQLLKETLKNKTINEVNKICVISTHKTCYYNAVIYPLNRSGQQNLAVRLDDISERVRVDQRFKQSTKLASIGVITAGFGGEIQEPIYSISAAIPLLESRIRYITDLFEKSISNNTILDLTEASTQAVTTKLKASIKEINYEFDNIRLHVDRASSIVKLLRTFTRLDENIKKKVNIHEGLDSTLTLLQHRFKNRINVIKKYTELPDIECYPGKLNQVFMSIIIHVIDSIQVKGEIQIITERANHYVIIRIKDNGVGMSKEVIEKIFDPLTSIFSNLGMGLATVCTIVQEHGGTIKVLSQVGEGSEFIITLPINE